MRDCVTFSRYRYLSFWQIKLRSSIKVYDRISVYKYTIYFYTQIYSSSK